MGEVAGPHKHNGGDSRVGQRSKWNDKQGGENFERI